MNLLGGFAAIADPMTLILVLFGVVLGLIFGSIPGLSAFTALALTLPLTFGMEPVTGLSFMLAIYVGGVSGGLISAILLGIPGTPASIATCFDGYPMAKRGEANRAMGIGIFYSFIGGIFSALMLCFFGPVLANFALKFGPYEYVAIILFSLTTVASLASGNLRKGLIAALLGIAFSMVGMDQFTASPRYTFGVSALSTGFNLIPLMIGVFAVAQIIEGSTGDKSEEKLKGVDASDESLTAKTKGFGFTMAEFIQHAPNMAAAALIGLAVGILPGIGGNVSNMMAYAFAKKQSKYPEKFGTGIMDGIVASETSNNAAVGGALTILMVLGIPGDNATSMILAAFLIHGLTPGPLLFTTNPDLVYAVFAAFILANVVMLICEFYGIKFFAKLLSIPSSILLAVVIVFCFVGSFSANNRIFDLGVMVAFGIIGYILNKFDYPASPLVVSFILAPLLEENLRRSLMRSEGSYMPILTSPIGFIFLALTVVVVVMTIRSELKNNKNAAA